MSNINFSLFASAVRTEAWYDLLDSLRSNTVSYEVVFAGPIEPAFTHPRLKHILTGDIKPAQCYEIARRACRGDLVMWIADDCEFSERLLNKVYDYWLSLNNRKSIISIRTNENESNNDLNDHRFFGWNVNTPQMAPLGVMNREYLNELGGLDRRYICGQYENDIVMRAYQDGASLHKFEDGYVKIDHLKKHGVDTKFWTAYQHDRTMLENSWVIGGYQPPPKREIVLEGGKHVSRMPLINREVRRLQFDGFEPYSDKDILTKSQSYKGIW